MAKLKRIPKHSYLYRAEKSDIIYYRRRFKNRLVEFSTGETGINRAKVFIEEKLKSLKILKPESKGKVRPNAFLKDLFNEWIDEKRSKGIQEATLKVNKAQWSVVLLYFFNDNTVLDLDERVYKKFELWYLKTFPKRVYYNCGKTLAEFIRWVKDQGYEIDEYKYKKDIEKTIKSNKKHEKVGRVFTSKEVEAILENADQRTRLGVLFAYLTGMRKKGFLSIELKNLEKDRVKVWSYKNKKWRWVPLPKRLQKEIESFLKAGLEGDKYLFRSFDRRGNEKFLDGQVFDRGWLEAKKKAKIKRGTEHLRARVHDLRHTCATNMAESGMPVPVACAILDMSLDIFEKTYCHVTEDSKREWMKSLYSESGD